MIAIGRPLFVMVAVSAFDSNLIWSARVPRSLIIRNVLRLTKEDTRCGRGYLLNQSIYGVLLTRLQELLSGSIEYKCLFWSDYLKSHNVSCREWSKSDESESSQTTPMPHRIQCFSLVAQLDNKCQRSPRNWWHHHFQLVHSYWQSSTRIAPMDPTDKSPTFRPHRFHHFPNSCRITIPKNTTLNLMPVTFDYVQLFGRGVHLSR